MTTAVGATVEIDPTLISIAAELPGPEYSTEELLLAGREHLSDELVTMLTGIGVRKRHSVLSNYGEVLFQNAEPKLDIATADLAVRAARTSLAKADVQPESIGLVLGVSSSPGRLLPSLVCDVIARMPEIPRTVANLSIEYMGCSAMAKVIETVRWYLSCHPDNTAQARHGRHRAGLAQRGRIPAGTRQRRCGPVRAGHPHVRAEHSVHP